MIKQNAARLKDQQAGDGSERRALINGKIFPRHIACEPGGEACSVPQGTSSSSGTSDVKRASGNTSATPAVTIPGSRPEARLAAAPARASPRPRAAPTAPRGTLRKRLPGPQAPEASGGAPRLPPAGRPKTPQNCPARPTAPRHTDPGARGAAPSRLGARPGTSEAPPPESSVARRGGKGRKKGRKESERPPGAQGRASPPFTSAGG